MDKAQVQQPPVQAPVIVTPDETVQILWSTVGYGRVGLGGILGYESKKVVPPEGFENWNFISAHSPSAIMIRNTKPIRLAGFFDMACYPETPVTFYASGNYVGQVGMIATTTETQYGEFVLWPDDHLLEIVLNGTHNAYSHTVWAYKIVEEK